MATTMIVCCYGNYDREHRSVQEMNGYREYLKGVAALIEERSPGYVVLCGGHTRPELKQSEAASVLPALEELRRDHYDVTFLLEERSVNTPQNLQLGLDRLIGTGAPLDELVVVSDYVRRWKVKVLMRRLTSIPWTVVGLNRLDIHPNSTPQRQFLETLKYLFSPRKRVFP